MAARSVRSVEPSSRRRLAETLSRLAEETVAHLLLRIAQWLASAHGTCY